ncbi:MAG: FAD-dependent monooxygenase [Microbacterium sp.]
MRIIIVGAGIGGLAAALSLEAAGFRDIDIYERAPEVLGLGVGINLLPHAMRELTELGLADRVEQLGVAPTTLSYHNRHGQRIWQEPRGRAAGYRWPQMSVHRGRLQLMLLEAVRERLGEVVHVDHRLVDVRHGTTGGGDRAEFETSRGSVHETADVIIGADGIHSAVRALHNPSDGPPVWSGLTVWRGTAVIPEFLDGRTMIMAGDGEQKFVAYPLGHAGHDGRTVVNFIAERRVGGSPDADWNRSVDPAPIVDMFQDWRFDWLDVPGTIAAADEILEYPMVDRNALSRWTYGRTVLLGDAAHAMYPNGSNGGSQAIIDARTLAFELASSPSADAALAAFDAARRPAMTALLELTRQTGPERVMQLAYERAPAGFADVDDIIPRAELQAIADEYKRAAGFSPDVLNARSSLTVAAGS